MASRGVVASQRDRRGDYAPLASRRGETPALAASRQNNRGVRAVKDAAPRAHGSFHETRGVTRYERVVSFHKHFPRTQLARAVGNREAPLRECPRDATPLASAEKRIDASRGNARHSPPFPQRGDSAAMQNATRVRFRALLTATACGVPELGIPGEAPPRHEPQVYVSPGRGHGASRGSLRGDEVQARVASSVAPPAHGVASRRCLAARQRLRLPPPRVARVVPHASAPRDKESSALRVVSRGHDSLKHGVERRRGLRLFFPFPKRPSRDANFSHQNHDVPSPRRVIHKRAPRHHDTLH